MSSKPLTTLFVGAIVAAVVSLLIASTTRPLAPSGTAKPVETAFERVVRTGHLRCAYISWSDSYFMKDPNTGAFHGMGYDLAMALADVLKVKIDWVEEVGLGGMYEGIKTGRYDAVCTPIIRDATGGPHATFTATAYYAPLFAYARADDMRFDKDDPHVFEKLNSPDVTVVDVEGTNAVEIHKNRYPKAHELFLPGMTPAPDIIAHVTTKKADITQQNQAFLEDFLKANPGALKRVSPALMVFPLSIVVVPSGDWKLKEWIDLALGSMLSIGTVDRILDKYDPARERFYHLSQPYQETPAHP